jgi:hypothetical protein
MSSYYFCKIKRNWSSLRQFYVSFHTSSVRHSKSNLLFEGNVTYISLCFLSRFLILLLIYFRIHVMIHSYINKDLPAFGKLLLRVHSSVRLLVIKPVAYVTKADYERYQTFCCIVIIYSTKLN